MNGQVLLDLVTERCPDVIAVGLWLAFWSKFISGVFYVKMLVAAAKPGSSGGRWRQGRGVLGYHACLLIVVLVVSHWVGWGVSWLIVTAYLPLFVRSGVGLWRLSNRLPRLKIVGLLEVCFTAWFVLFCGLVLRALVQGIP